MLKMVFNAFIDNNFLKNLFQTKGICRNWDESEIPP